MTTDWLKLLREVGFPIAVAAFLLVRLESRLELLTAAVQNNTAALDVLKNELSHVTSARAAK